MTAITQDRRQKQKPEWVELVVPYRQPDVKTSLWQLASSLIMLIVCAGGMYWGLAAGYWWVTALLLVPTTGFVMRLFIIQHDCGHGSFFKSRKANDRVGMLASLFTLTPYHHWRKRHAIHHATSSNLDERFIGDVPTWTVDEYLAKDKWNRLKYRLFRYPLVLFVIVPFAVFFILHRFPSKSASKLERRGIFWTNIAIGLLWAGVIALFGWKAFLLVNIPVMWLASSIGTWLFFVQHQFEETYWEHQEEWEYVSAALKGSSYYKLPKVLQWFTGNIGFHHIHHLSPRIPNYKLEKCHNENPLFQRVLTMTLRTSLETTFLSLWDKEQRKLISFGQLRRQRRAAASA